MSMPGEGEIESMRGLYKRLVVCDAEDSVEVGVGVVGVGFAARLWLL